jgi:hypothetical protein
MSVNNWQAHFANSSTVPKTKSRKPTFRVLPRQTTSARNDAGMTWQTSAGPASAHPSGVITAAELIAGAERSLNIPGESSASSRPFSWPGLHPPSSSGNQPDVSEGPIRCQTGGCQLLRVEWSLVVGGVL